MDRLTSLYIGLIRGQIGGFIAFPDGQYTLLEAMGRKINIYSGSFDPLHDGHRSVFDAIKGTKYFEISTTRRDKEFIELDDLERRIKQFEWYAPIIVLNAPKYIDKLKSLGKKKIIFHIGIDTAKRMIEDHSIKWIETLPTSFVIYDRIIDGTLRGLRNIRNKPKNFIEGMTPDKKYLHVNSTELRK